MSYEKFIFYIFAALLVYSASMVIVRRNPVHSALFLVFAFFNSAVLWMLLEAEFLAITLVLVYVGAVMVLFLFVIMMLDIELAAIKAGFVRYMGVGALIALAMLVELAMVVGPAHFGLDKYAKPAATPANALPNTEAIGEQLYTVYLYPFEIAAVILLVGIVAAIGLTLRRRPEKKTQNITEQVRVKRADRVRLVKMDAER
ncbi:MAG: NADH-quinone oxidoreductase subunit J [Gammaproteobacteria bacterium]|nr:NADH-quinone oxidoreductase subunit J [Gammaproteobacteria bacterium]MBU1654922.1 NADH-quinone oxidoreductase subunit J [Gammaproteobacteria bacterium]MBU1960371.1 NADH-quinone oxidoreductase subunit J [Gammaproteobacteria bacterium]